MTSAPATTVQLDIDTVRAFVAEIHEHAARACRHLDRPGLLQLSKIGPDEKLSVAGRFRIGDVDGMADLALAHAEAGSNVFVEPRTVREDIEPRKRGDLEDSRAVFALVVDRDAYSGKSGDQIFDPTIRVETSPGSAHDWLVFESAVAPNQAKALGDMLRRASQADANTGNPVQPYRVAGTPNFPTEKKKALGRVTCPTTFADGGPLYSPDELRAALLPFAQPEYELSHIDEDRTGFVDETVERLLAVPVPIGKRSERFAHALYFAVETGMTRPDFETLCREHPEGPAGKYFADGGRDDLAKRVEEAWNPHAAEIAEKDALGARLVAQLLESRAKRTAATPELRTVDADTLHGIPVPPRLFHVDGIIPARNVTLLTGDGGTGKSLLALQLAASTALGCKWIGREVQHGRALYLSAEDELDELHRRLSQIVTAYGRSLADLGALRLVPLAGEDAVLAAPEARSSLLTPTRLFRQVKDEIARFRPAIVTLDTLADMYGGDEIQRIQARQFIALLRGLALEFDTTIILLAHPSKAGLADETGDSGSTGWKNSVRSRLYFKREGDSDARTLDLNKFNYGPIGQKIELRWHEGVFVPEVDLQALAGDAGGTAEQAFLACLDKVEREGRYVSAAPTSGNYAPKMFAGMPTARGLRRDKLKRAMESLFHDGRIRIVEHRKSNRHSVEIIERVRSEDADAV